MATNDNLPGLMPSFLDRLIDPQSSGTEARRGYSIDRMMEVVRRDVEELLNTRHTSLGLPPGLDRLYNSVFSYGLPDLVTFTALTPKQREDIGHVLESIIAMHEPRLRDVRATLMDNSGDKRPIVRFRLEARVALDPAPEVAFDTILELTTGHHSVVKS